MKLLRVYVDTSVFGGYFDTEFADPSKKFFKEVFDKRLILLLSEILITEIESAPVKVKNLLKQTLQTENHERLILSPEIMELQKAYLKAGVVTRKYADDALHVAQATIARADVIVSWNFKHLVNPDRIRGFNGINITQGYGLIVIMTPIDLVQMIEVNYGRKANRKDI